MSIKDRGFAHMEKARVRAIASLGGIARAKLRVVHFWTSEEASIAGKKGVQAKRRDIAVKKSPVAA